MQDERGAHKQLSTRIFEMTLWKVLVRVIEEREVECDSSVEALDKVRQNIKPNEEIIGIGV